MKTRSSIPFVLAAIAGGAVFAATNPHEDPITGVDRVATIPPTTGECTQCHDLHGEDGAIPEAKTLFAPNDNMLCASAGGPNGCHQAMPPGYPATETDRLPDGADAPGYFEAHNGTERAPGVLLRRRWTGITVYTDARTFGDGRFFSPHAHDIDMPRRDGGDEGLCLNCHDPHEGKSDHDLLTAVYQAYGGTWDGRASTRFALCLDCHGPRGPFGMDTENRAIADYYDDATNPDGTAGHAIRRDPNVALAWPAYMRVGDPLPCYDCHNPHGSRGADGASPNGFLVSDQRPGWYGLTDTKTDPTQNRRFCLGCHIPSDGIPGSIEVSGIVMNTLPAAEPAHTGLAQDGCFSCHGADYSTPTSFNVHHPNPGSAP